MGVLTGAVRIQQTPWHMDSSDACVCACGDVHMWGYALFCGVLLLCLFFFHPSVQTRSM